MTRSCSPNSAISSAPLVRRSPIEQLLHGGGRRAGELARQLLRLAGVLAHTQVERGARQHHRVVEPAAHLDGEPAVDAAVEELERRQVHDQERCDHQRAEDPDGAGGKTRARHVRAVVVHQPPHLAHHQHGEHRDGADVEQQDPALQPLELRGVAHAHGEQQERGGGDRAPQQPERPGVALRPPLRARLYIGSDHVYHSLTRAQSLVQNSSARSDAGSDPRRTPARTLMV